MAVLLIERRATPDVSECVMGIVHHRISLSDWRRVGRAPWALVNRMLLQLGTLASDREQSSIRNSSLLVGA